MKVLQNVHTFQLRRTVLFFTGKRHTPLVFAEHTNKVYVIQGNKLISKVTNESIE